MSDNNRRTAVVIGAGSGMGTAVARRLHVDGYHLVLADLKRQQLQTLSAELDAETAELDITDDSAVGELVHQCRAGVDALVITAGLSASMAPFERIVDVNLGGSVRVVDAFAEVINEGGVAVCFSSIAGHLCGPIPHPAEEVLLEPAASGLGKRVKQALPPAMQIPGMAYAVSKLGVLKLVQRSAGTWGSKGARICSVSPGLIDTPMGKLERNVTPEADNAVKAAPIPRLGSADQVANVVAFLCSTQASYITGCDILVDGGWVGAIQSEGANSPLAAALSSGRQKA